MNTNFSKEMGAFNFIDKYAQTKKDGNKESWEESIDRIWDMNLIQLKNRYDRMNPVKKQEAYIKDLFDIADQCRELEKTKKFLSAQRARQWASTDRGILDKNERIYNCTGSYADRIDFFGEAMYLLLCGCGVGYSVCKEHTNKLPAIPATLEDSESFVFFIEDTIEGWGDAVKHLFYTAMYRSRIPTFDYSLIRPAGSLISGRFKHSGYEPLKRALDQTAGVLKGAKGRKLKPIECFDIVCFLAEAVLSGGVRRSATICLFDWNDKDMLEAKVGDWYSENPQRAMANISPLMVRDKTRLEDLEALVDQARHWGEPGVVFVDNINCITNPCAEIGMIPKTPDGKSGWQFCNLVEINCAAIEDEQDFYNTCRYASFAATIQASYDRFPYLGKTTEQIVRAGALIGVSLTGIMDSSIELTAEILKSGAEHVVAANSVASMALDIQPAKRCTTVKPSGNASILLGTTAGIHPAHSSKYLRHIRVNKNSDMAKFIKAKAPELIVNDGVSKNPTAARDIIIAFPITTNAKCKSEFNFESFFDYVTFVYDNWVRPGDLGLESATHNVSNTITIKTDEWDDVAKVLFKNKEKIGGFSFLSDIGDTVYPYAPYMQVNGTLGSELSESDRKEIKELVRTSYMLGENIYEATQFIPQERREQILKEYARYHFNRIHNSYIAANVDWNSFNTNELINIGNMAAISCSGGKCDL